nr:response regulator transcription factor [Actinomyces capricornis]
MLAPAPDIDVVGQAVDGAEAIRLTEALDPDVVLMDLRMPGMGGAEATRRITSPRGPSHGGIPRVVVLTTYDTDGDILSAMEAGAIGYLLKDSPRETILASVRAAAVGHGVLSPTVTSRLAEAARGAGGTGSGDRAAGAAEGRAGGPAGGRRGVGGPVGLSPRERQILEAVARGLSNSQIGQELFITGSTVKTHLLRVYGKLGVDTRTAAVTEALRRGLLDLG